MKQKPAQHCKQGDTSIASTTRVGRSPSGHVARDVPSPWPTAPRSAPCLETTCRTLQPPAPPNVFCRAFLRAQGLGFLQDDAINVGTPRARLSISAQHRHQSDVHRPVGRRGTGGNPSANTSTRAFIQTVGRDDIHVLDPDVRGDPGPSLATNTSSRRLHRETAPTQNPATAHATRWWPLGSSGRPHPANTAGRREREPQTAEEENTEHLRVETGLARHWATREKNAGQRSALRTQQGPRRAVQPGPHGALHELGVHKLGGPILPPMFGAGRVLVVCPTWWAAAHREFCPLRSLKPHINQNLPSCCRALDMDSWDVVPQCADHDLRNVGVPLDDLSVR